LWINPAFLKKQKPTLRRVFAALMLFTINVNLTSHSQGEYSTPEIKKQV